MKRKSSYLLVLLISILNFGIAYSNGNVFNVKEYGAKGDGKTDDSAAINNLIQSINRKIPNEISFFSPKNTIYFPAGTYILKKEISLPKSFDLVGESNQSSILKVTGNNNGAIIITFDKKDETRLYTGYNEIKNLAILGPDFDKNPSAWKDIKRNNSKSVGIKILGVKNRITSCTISGFLWSGIETSSSYFNFIQDCYFLNNRVGLIINNISTTAMVSNNEFRFNGAGIRILNNSFGNHITNNIIEANIANFLTDLKSETDNNIEGKGVGILISNSQMNFINNNYFEQHFVSFLLDNATENNISNNYVAILDLMPYKGKDQQLLRFINRSKHNLFVDNRLSAPNRSINKFNITFDSPNTDYSSNIIRFNNEEKESIKNNLKSKNRNKNLLPTFDF